MLTEIAEGVFVHESEFIQSNCTIVEGRDGVLLVDPGITSAELDGLADDLRSSGRRVVAGFSTHPDWDHVLWHARFGDVPRYATAEGAASMRRLLAQPDWQAQLADVLPPEHADDIPLDLFGALTPLPHGADHVPWDGPRVRIVEHRAHARGHAALLVDQRRVLVAGDMLSDILIPFLDLEAADPLGDYLDALDRIGSLADSVDVVVPGHGAVGGSADLRARIALDRAYVEALRDGRPVDDPRVGPSAPLYWLSDVHEWQAGRIAGKRSSTAP
jgi:glyoxylase-like metal-dependent hydrolase (beta-lactamase superfamily II)